MNNGDNNNSSDLGRRPSRTGSARLSIGPGDDDDDYDLQAMGVADGFRPAEVTQDQTVPYIAHPSPALERPDPRPESPRPSSIEKSCLIDESSPETSGRASAASSSASGDSPIMPVETPYNGPSGPSHPYQMYPQNVRQARVRSSTATSAGSVSERSYTGPHHPAHPYGIYPQNVTSGDDEASNHPPQVNVGFPGTTDRYERRLGPDGEEAADMIGPDGHTEQLPPYTRYPEEGYGQKAVAVAANTPQPAQQNLEIPGAGGIGLATRNPEFPSTEDLNRANSPQSRRSVRSIRSEASRHSMNDAPLVVINEKATSNWKDAARRRVWGFVPCWAVVLGVIIMVLLGVVVGTVIGIHLDQSSRDNNSRPPTDQGFVPGYEPLTNLPPGFPDLPEGSWSLPLSHPRYSNKCIKDQSQSEAWNCHAIMSELVMTISSIEDSAPTASYALEFSYNSSYTEDSFVYSYGVQPPSLVPQRLQLVNDTFEPELGAAWAFILPYNKTIVLPQTYLSASTSSNFTPTDVVQRRMNMNDFDKKGLAQIGERPWLCTWPATILEVFIYPEHDGTGQGDATNVKSRRNVLTRNEMTEESRKEAEDPPYSHDSHKDDNEPYSRGPSSTTTPTPTSSVSSPTDSTTAAQTDYFSPPPMPSPQYSPYPKMVKFEERRDPGIVGAPPVCRQVQIVANGEEAVPVLNSAGYPTEIVIEEILPGEEKMIAPYALKQRSLLGRHATKLDEETLTDELDGCGCIWWLS